MRPAAPITLSLAFLLAFSAQAQNPNPDAIRMAQDQAVRQAALRQEAMTSLETTLRAADAAQKAEGDPGRGESLPECGGELLSAVAV